MTSTQNNKLKEFLTLSTKINYPNYHNIKCYNWDFIEKDVIANLENILNQFRHDDLRFDKIDISDIICLKNNRESFKIKYLYPDEIGYNIIDDFSETISIYLDRIFKEVSDIIIGSYGTIEKFYKREGFNHLIFNYIGATYPENVKKMLIEKF